MLAYIPIMESEIRVKGRTVVYRIVPGKGWAVVVKEDKILIDNYHHGYPHIHPDREPIKTDDVYEVVKIVVRHIEKYGKVVIEKLRDELCG